MTDRTVGIPGRLLNPGTAAGPVLKLDTPVSFWGGVDTSTGLIVDVAHPQKGSNMAGTILAMSGSRGSSGTPGVLGEMLRLGTGPAAIVLTKPDINLIAGALVAATLYNTECPVILVDIATFDALSTDASVFVGDGS